MKRFNRIALAFALSSLALPGFAAGFTGTVTFDKADPTYNVGELVKMNIHGMGVCKDIVVDWGDGEKTNVPNHDFDASNHVLEQEHKYLTRAGSMGVVVSDAPGKPLSAPCGSRSSMVKVMPNGIVTGLTTNKAKVQSDETVIVSVNGSGICAGQMTLVYNTQPVGTVYFARNAKWPRQAPFKFKAEGDYFFTVWTQADAGFDSAPCSYTTDKPPVKFEVKNIPFVLNPALVIPVHTVSPVVPKLATPAKPVAR